MDRWVRRGIVYDPNDLHVAIVVMKSTDILWTWLIKRKGKTIAQGIKSFHSKRAAISSAEKILICFKDAHMESGHILRKAV